MKKVVPMQELLNEFRTWQTGWDVSRKGMNAEDFCASLEEKYEVTFKTEEKEILDLSFAAQSTLQRLYEMTESREAREQIDSAMTYLNRAYFNTEEK